MRDNPYKDLPPLERRPDGSLYRMTPAQKKQAASLIRRECCCFEDGNCIVLVCATLGFSAMIKVCVVKKFLLSRKRKEQPIFSIALE